jgi:hypothetical protein
MKRIEPDAERGRIREFKSHTLLFRTSPFHPSNPLNPYSHLLVPARAAVGAALQCPAMQASTIEVRINGLNGHKRKKLNIERGLLADAMTLLAPRRVRFVHIRVIRVKQLAGDPWQHHNL